MSVEVCKWCGVARDGSANEETVGYLCGTWQYVGGKEWYRSETCELRCAERRIADLERQLEEKDRVYAAAEKHVTRLVMEASQRAEGKDHWLVVGGKNIDAESVIHDGPIDAMQFAQIYGGEVLHVREVVDAPEPERPFVPSGVVMDAIRADQSPFPRDASGLFMSDLGDGWFSTDAIQIIDYDWRYAGWTDGTRRYGPMCCTGPLTTFDTVVIRDEWGNDLLTWEGMQKHCNEIEKRLEELEQANQALSSINQLFYERAESLRSKVADLEQQLDDAMELLRESFNPPDCISWTTWRDRVIAFCEKYGDGK